MEYLLLQLQDRKTEAGSGLVNALLTGVGALKDMLDNVGKSDAYSIDPAFSLLEKYAAPAGEFEKKITVREIPRQDAANNDILYLTPASSLNPGWTLTRSRGWRTAWKTRLPLCLPLQPFWSRIFCPRPWISRNSGFRLSTLKAGSSSRGLKP
ncbi:MAG: hypothetical protein U9P10_11545 [Thermodesulfobacteriota bacterium]|nr:hypothetical protein [Thermodesulfobacteriota bacterium]